MDIDPPDLEQEILNGGTASDDDYFSDDDEDPSLQEISHAGGEYSSSANVARKAYSIMTSTNK